MNLLAVIFLILIVWRALKGLKNGFAKEINGLLSLFMALVVISIALLLLGGIVQKNTRLIIISSVMLIIVSGLYRLLGTVMKSVETMAKLPIISLVNVLAGALAGAMEVIVVFWMLYIIVDSFPTGQFGERIKEWTEQSAILVNIYNKNYIARWIMDISL